MIHMVAFGLSVLVLLWFIYSSTAGFMERQTDETINAEIQGLSEVPAAGEDVIAVPDERKADYRDFSAGHAALFKEYGARRIVDAWGDDVPDGKLTDFKGAVKAQAGETVVFSWVEWPSRDVRAAAWGRMMEDPRMQALEMPFDGKRVVYGGVAPILDTGRG